jgi:phage anti-repressor protein
MMADNIVEQIDEELVKKLMNGFDTDEQKMFVRHFQLYLQYGNQTNQFVIDLDDIWAHVGFSTKGTAKRHLLKYYKQDTDFTVINSLAKRDVMHHGGQNKERVMMNVDTFKAFCMTANTEKGRQTRQYYSKMETIFFQYMEAKNKDIIQRLQMEHKLRLARERHDNLKEAHKDTPCVYLFKISETDDDNFIVKLGETDDIEQRIASLRQEYKDCTLLDVFPCTRPHKFEQYLLNRPDIKSNRVVGTELIEISVNFTYKTLTTIIDKHVDYFDNTPFHEKLELARMKYLDTASKERLQLMQMINTTDDHVTKQKLTEMLIQLSDNHANAPSDCVQETIEESVEKQTNRKVYQYSPSDLSIPIGVYNTLKDAARSLCNSKIHDYHVRSACYDNTILCNYRWYLVDGDVQLPACIPQTTEQQEVQQRRHGLVAQLNKEKNRIINVYPTQNEAASSAELAACTITIAISKQIMAGGYYWIMYEDCDDILKSSFKEDLPTSRLPSTSSKMVERIDPDSDSVLETFKCIQDVCSKYKTSHKTVHKVSKSGDIYKGFKWRVIDCQTS